MGEVTGKLSVEKSKMLEREWIVREKETRKEDKVKRVQ